MSIPALEFRILSMLQNVLLALEVWVVEADEGAALHADRVDPVHETSILEVVTLATDLQLPPRETFSLIEHNLFVCQNNSEDLNILPPNRHLHRHTELQIIRKI